MNTSSKVLFRNLCCSGINGLCGTRKRLRGPFTLFVSIFSRKNKSGNSSPNMKHITAMNKTKILVLLNLDQWSLFILYEDFSHCSFDKAWHEHWHTLFKIFESFGITTWVWFICLNDMPWLFRGFIWNTSGILSDGAMVPFQKEFQKILQSVSLFSKNCRWHVPPAWHSTPNWLRNL